MYISNTQDLAAFCNRISSSSIVAVDTEFIRERSYHPKLCLIQVATHEESAVVDPLAVEDLTALAELFSNPKITKVMHACTQDLEVILDAMGIACTPVFDTQLAAAFLGMRQQVGYAAVVDAYIGVRLPKAEALTDWSHRPLDNEQLVYAEDDVRYLPDIYDAMITQLVAKNRLGWLRPEMEQLTDPARYARQPREAYLRLRRSGSLTRRQMGVARELCAWREEAASERDVPRKWIISDELIVEMCKRLPKTVERVRKIRGSEQLSGKDIASLAAAVRAGLGCPSEELPQAKRPARMPEGEGVPDLMNALLRIVSEKSGVASQMIATKDDLADLAAGRGGRLREGWRYELAGKQLEQLLAGELGLTIKNGRIELL